MGTKESRSKVTAYRGALEKSDGVRRDEIRQERMIPRTEKERQRRGIRRE